MNPQQRSIADDTITKNYIPSNSDTNGHFYSTEFIDLLRTNAMTKHHLITVAKYYGVNDEWNNATSGQPFSIKHYYKLLLMVKKTKHQRSYLDDFLLEFAQTCRPDDVPSLF
jgi:hypothetical protein